MLKLDGVETFYGKVQALKGISIEVPEKNIVTILGANGAGKSTALRTISGLTPPSKGTIKFNDEEVSRIPPELIVKKGISHVPEGRDLFPELTVMENLRMGAYTRDDKEEIEHNYERVFHSFPVLWERKNQFAGTLSGGEQQMLAIARALMSSPSLILLDEPSLGLAPLLVDEIFRIIREINKEGTTILLVEQNANMALQAAQYGYVLETGRIVLHDRTEALVQNDHVRKTYLGVR
ncbi:MAG: ATP-binding cassette domain-containing protein [Proteobacteria bacterium]|nr:ATP-binding cassette domain-containing protein [Pseudomonadota bacterium]